MNPRTVRKALKKVVEKIVVPAIGEAVIYRGLTFAIGGTLGMLAYTGIKIYNQIS